MNKTQKAWFIVLRFDAHLSKKSQRMLVMHQAELLMSYENSPF